MKRTNGSLARHARPLFVIATLVSSIALAFTPSVPAAIALSASPEASAPASPSPSASPAGSPAPDPTPDPTADPTPAPTADVAPTPAPEVAAPSAADVAPVAPVKPRALSLDATRHQYGLVADDPAFHLSVFTIETWFRRNAPRTGDPVGMSGVATSTVAGDPAAAGDDAGLPSAIPLVTRGAGVDRSGRLDWFVGFDTQSAVLVADFEDAHSGHHPVRGTTVLADATWYHVAAAYDGNTWRLYLNGRLEAERRVGDVVPDTSGASPVGLGTALSADGTAHGAFDGDLDETQIWAVARTGAEIRERLAKSVDPKADGLVAAWSMDEADGDVIVDSTAGHLDGNLAGGPARSDSPVPDLTIPARPRSLSATAGIDHVTLHWLAVRADDLAGYNVYRTDSGRVTTDGEPLNGPVPVGDTGYSDTSARANGSYSYVVTAVDTFGNESPASEGTSVTVEAAPTTSGVASAAVAPSPTPSAASEPSPTPAAPPVAITLTSDAPVEGRHRVDPGAVLTLTVGLTAPADTSRTDLALSIPTEWTVLDADGGIADAASHRIAWLLADVPEGSASVHKVRVIAPAAPPLGPSTFTASLERPTETVVGPSLDVLVAPEVVVAQPILAKIDPASLQATYLPAGTPITDQQRFEAFRVRFLVGNADDLAATIVPRLEYRPLGGSEFKVVPAPDAQSGVPFFVGREWMPIPGGSGTQLGPLSAEVPSDEILPGAIGAVSAVAGIHSMGANPLTSVELPAGAATAVEFSVRATAAADYLAGYEFRITDGGKPLAGAPVANVTLGEKPTIRPTTIMRNGVAASDPGAEPLTSSPPRYALVVSQEASQTPHGGYSATPDACAACHSSHSASSRTLLVNATPQSGLCLNCHRAGGAASSTDVESQYADPTVPQNDPASRTWYSHDDLAAVNADRRPECTACHSPHAATSTASVQTSSGWTASGRLGQASGVAVANSPDAGGTPTYTLIGGSSAPLAFEYQLCFKCHSGYAQLPSNDGLTPSRDLLDKGIELNPKNPSFHPIEAPGTNSTEAMQGSLSGPSTYKLWNFSTTSTIRCENCHGNDRTVAAALATATPLDPGADLAPHANQPQKDPVAAAVPGILSATYKYRELKGSRDSYDPSDFALCFTCHSEEPFLDTSGSARSDTNFPGHGRHVSGIANRGPAGTDIDKAGDGGGLATCAECHFRIHSTTYRVGGQEAYPRLVNFAPNVTADGSTTDPVGTDAWDPTTKTCTLTCHGQGHSSKGY